MSTEDNGLTVEIGAQEEKRSGKMVYRPLMSFTNSGRTVTFTADAVFPTKDLSFEFSQMIHRLFRKADRVKESREGFAQGKGFSDEH